MSWHRWTREEKRVHLEERGDAWLVALDDKYPKAGMLEPSCISAEIGPGWAKLLEPCLEVLARLGCHTTQVKQKFCELRVYWDGPAWLHPAHRAWFEAGKPGPDPYDLFKEVGMVITLASHRSLFACEECGAQAKHTGTIRGGTRLCVACEAKRLEKLQKER